MKFSTRMLRGGSALKGVFARGIRAGCLCGSFAYGSP